MSREHIHFVTGRLASRALQSLLQQLGPAAGFDYSVDVLPITVAALMTPRWIARHIQVPAQTTRVVLPGYCDGELEPLREQVAVAVERGPRDLRDLPEYFGRAGTRGAALEQHDIEIVAEINHAPRLERAELLRVARQLAQDGADVIDVGCDPGDTWPGVGDCVRALRDAGLRVSIDSWNADEVAAAARAGAELVLSVNSSNWEAARDWGCEVVVVPDEPATMAGLEETVERLSNAGVPLRIDPILEPIGCGLAASLGRYLAVRARYPDAEMLMGIGNLTELTDCDSAAINLLLLGFCQELGIRSVLTTQVINWARTSVRECELARRLVYHAVAQRVPPKHLDDGLVMLRDARVKEFGREPLEQLAADLKDSNYRLFAEQGRLHLVSAGLHLEDDDPFRLFDQLQACEPGNLDASHAFYLGYELAKAATALALGKSYQQDRALDWGLLTVEENSHRLARTAERRASSAVRRATGERSGGDGLEPGASGMDGDDE
ncbi:MAG: dihydropteroate synthase [Pirellulaceae bacterium]|nr:dihydropteroate synthase [Pirellulaceae bacterium]